ncbi:MAG: glycosyltransferase family 2 protein [Trueperaceae bacterium]
MQTVLRASKGSETSLQRTADVSVIMPVYNEADHIEVAVRSVLDNDLAPERLEVLVVDGMSTDGTREIVCELAKEHPRVRLVDNREKTVPYALNRGLGVATGEVIIRVDGHATVAPDFVRSCLAELDAHPECGCVGGPIENVNVNETARAISLAMSSPFGVGNARFRLGDYEGYVDTLAFGAYRREVFDRVGRFDELLTRNQDDEFNYRLARAGIRIWLSPRIRSRYVVRSSFAKLFRQYYQYGYWKVYVNRKHGAVTSLRQLVPVVFMVALGLCLLAAPVVPAARWALLLVVSVYLAGALGFALIASRGATPSGATSSGATSSGAASSSDRPLGDRPPGARARAARARAVRSRRPATIARIVAAFALLHSGYGLGYLEGVLRFLVLGLRPAQRNTELSR